VAPGSTDNGDPPPPLAREFIDALTKLGGEVRGLRDDLGRIYGRDAAGRLLAQAPQDGGPAPMPTPKWTPRDVKDMLETVFSSDPAPRRRRR